MALDKVLAEDIVYAADPSHSAMMAFSAPLVDANGANIQGLTVDIVFRVGQIVPDDCYYHFTVFTFRAGVGRKRAYQLEVVPIDKRSHNDDVRPCWGPHEHIGDFVAEVRNPKLDCTNHHEWFREFCARANIRFGMRYSGPFDGGLFRGM